jgi:hypothetical protein
VHSNWQEAISPRSGILAEMVIANFSNYRLRWFGVLKHNNLVTTVVVGQRFKERRLNFIVNSAGRSFIGAFEWV